MSGPDAFAPGAVPLAVLHVDEIVTGYRDKGAASLAPVFAQYGSASFEGGFDPPRGALAHPDLQGVFDQYAALPAEGDLPHWNDDIPFHFKSVLRNLHVIDFVSENRLRYKIFASAVADYFGQDATGMSLPVDGISIGVIFHALALIVAERREKLYTQHVPPNNSKVYDCQRLYLPFQSSSGDVHRILVAQFPFRRGPELPDLHPDLMR